MIEKNRKLAWIKERENKMCSAEGKGKSPRRKLKKSRGLAGERGLGPQRASDGRKGRRCSQLAKGAQKARGLWTG